MSELVLPHTGELVDLSDAQAVASTLDRLGELERVIRSAKRELVEALEPLAEVEGTRTLQLGEWKVELTAPQKIEYDLELLRERLLDAGLPEHRMADLITETVSYKLNRSVARQLRATNPQYAEALDLAEATVPATVYAKVTRAA